METIRLIKIDEVYFKVQANPGILVEIAEAFKFRPAGYKYMAAYKNRAWDGFIRIFKPMQGLIGIGMLNSLKEFAEDSGYNIEVVDHNHKEEVTVEQVIEYAQSLQLSDGKNPIKIREYQAIAVAKALSTYRATTLLPTAAGKSLVAYVTIRYLIDHDICKHILLIVPTVSLVDQMVSDFKEYSTINGWDVAAYSRKIRAGLDKIIDTPLTVSTWQSCVKMRNIWIKQIDGFILDEAHTIAGKSIESLLSMCTDAKFRFGMTGTIDEEQGHHFILRNMIGDIHEIITTRQLMDQGYIDQLKITGIHLIYSDQEKKDAKKFDYQKELSFIIDHKKRSDFIIKFANSLDGNVLILFDRIAHGKKIKKALEEITDTPVYYVAGEVKPEDREKIRKTVMGNEKSIIVASFGTFKMGINIPNLNHAIFIHPGKAKIRTLQSIGRILRKSAKDAKLFDIIDDMSWKSAVNFCMRHAAERFKIYAKSEFECRVKKVKL